METPNKEDYNIQQLKAGNSGVLGDMYRIFVAEGGAVAQQYARAIAKHMQLLRGKDLLTLRDLFAKSYALGCDNWNNVSARSIQVVVPNREHCFYVLALGTFHPNGYFRERCATQLAAYGTKALPYLLLLVNHWVEPIRLAATAHVEQMMLYVTIEETLSNLYYIERLCDGKHSRSIVKWLFHTAQQRLLVGDALTTERILACDRDTRRIVYRLVSSQLSIPQQTELLQTEPDAFSKLLVAKQLAHTPLPESVWELMLQHSSTSVRYIAVRNRHRLEPKWDGLESFLFDSYRSIRDYVAFIFRKRGCDIRSLYLAKLEQEASTGVIYGLGECGRKEDIPLILPYLDDIRPAYQKAALTAIAMLQGEDAAAMLYHFCSVPWAAKTAFRLILRYHYQYTGEWCYRNYIKAPSAHQKHYFFRLLCGAKPWEKLLFLVKIYPALSPQERKIALLHLRQWNPGYLPPTKQQVSMITTVMGQNRLPKKVEYYVLFVLCTSDFFDGLL